MNYNKLAVIINYIDQEKKTVFLNNFTAFYAYPKNQCNSKLIIILIFLNFLLLILYLLTELI